MEFENIPNASKLLDSLRHLDYTNQSAICDIVDNCFDANASVVRIRLIPDEASKGLSRIEIWDDGSGMDETTLREALKLGSDTEKNPQYDLGRYGMGLVTASISIGQRLVVTTLLKDTCYEAAQDLDEIRKENRFFIKFAEVEEKYYSNFLKNLRNATSVEASSGTRVIIDKIDSWKWKLLSASEVNISETLGRVFRKFIHAGKEIWVNDIKVQAIDPIADFEPVLLNEETINVEGKDVELKIYKLKDYGVSLNREKKLNITNQGFYVLRNNREISGGQDFNVFSKHNDFNLFRAEISYPGTLDHILNAGFTKQNIDPESNQSFLDKLKQSVQPYLKQIRNAAKEKQKDDREHKEDFSEVEKFITRKAHLLSTPLATQESRASKSKPSQEKKETQETRSPRLDITRKKRVDLDSANVNFRTKQMDKSGPVFTSEVEGKVTVINWNIDHPFYEEFVIPNEGKKDVLNPVLFLIYSLASAELRANTGSDSELILENIRADISKNLRVLLT